MLVAAVAIFARARDRRRPGDDRHLAGRRPCLSARSSSHRSAASRSGRHSAGSSSSVSASPASRRCSTSSSCSVTNGRCGTSLTLGLAAEPLPPRTARARGRGAGAGRAAGWRLPDRRRGVRWRSCSPSLPARSAPRLRRGDRRDHVDRELVPRARRGRSCAICRGPGEGGGTARRRRGRWATLLVALAATGFAFLYDDLVALLGSYSFGLLAAAAPAVGIACLGSGGRAGGHGFDLERDLVPSPPGVCGAVGRRSRRDPGRPAAGRRGPAPLHGRPDSGIRVLRKWRGQAESGCRGNRLAGGGWLSRMLPIAAHLTTPPSSFGRAPLHTYGGSPCGAVITTMYPVRRIES